jgi:hypothetical protein
MSLDPGLLAHLDQRGAQNAGAIDKLITEVRQLLDFGIPEPLATEQLAALFLKDPSRSATGFAVAIVRLAKQKAGGAR